MVAQFVCVCLSSAYQVLIQHQALSDEEYKEALKKDSIAMKTCKEMALLWGNKGKLFIILLFMAESC